MIISGTKYITLIKEFDLEKYNLQKGNFHYEVGLTDVSVGLLSSINIVA